MKKLEQNIYRFALLCVCVCVCRRCWMLLWWYKRRRRRRYYREKTIVEIEWEWESFINHERLPKFSFFLFYSTKGRRVLASRLCRLKRNSTDLRVFLSLSLLRDGFNSSSSSFCCCATGLLVIFFFVEFLRSMSKVHNIVEGSKKNNNNKKWTLILDETNQSHYHFSISSSFTREIRGRLGISL